MLPAMLTRSARQETTDDIQTVLRRAANLLDRAEADPVLLGVLAERPLDVAVAEDIDLWLLLKCVLGLHDATDREMLDVLGAHIRRAEDDIQRRASCGNCGVDTCSSNPPDWVL